MTCRDLVFTYLREARRIVTLFEGAEIVRAAGGPSGFMGMTIGRTYPRVGSLPNGVAYLRHGVGFRLSVDDVTVDLDLDTENRWVFNDWRVAMFALDRDIAGCAQEDLSSALSELADEGLLRHVRDGWFAFGSHPPAPA